jgi:hypothetical protein
VRSSFPHRVGKIALFLVVGVLQSLLGGASCSTSEAGLEVNVQLVPPPAGAAPITSDRGYAVTLERAYLTVGSVELEGCENAVLPSLELPFGPKLAFAHSVTSPTRIGSPAVLSLAGEEAEQVSFGTLGPPPGEYCALRVGLEPADADASHLPNDVDFVGLTLTLEGTYRDSSGTEGAFSVATTQTIERSVPFERLELGDDAEREAVLVVNADSARWFDGIDFATVEDEEIAELVLSNVVASLEVSVQ